MYKIYSNIVDKKNLRKVQLDTLNIISDALSYSFGPNGKNTSYRRKKDIARYTKDGHTILKNLSFTGPIEFTMKDDLEGITRRIVTTVGDGTTSAIILSYYIFYGLCLASDNLHIDEKVLVADLKNAINEACDFISANGKEATVDDIFKIAMISTDGNSNIAQIIKDIYDKNGMDVFIDVSTASGLATETKTYDGFTIESGLSDIAFINTDNHTCTLNNVQLYLFEDPIDNTEMGTYFAKIVTDNIMEPLKAGEYDKVVPTTIVCPKIGKDILTDIDTLVRTIASRPISERKFYPINIVTNIANLNYINDLAYISGATLIKKYTDAGIQADDGKIALAQKLENIHTFSGHCEQVVSDSRKSKFINPSKMYNEKHELSDIYKNHLTDMEEQLAGLVEENGSKSEIGVLKRRINSFKANLVEIRVGGVSETDRDSLRDLVEDAVLNCRSAATDGFGYGSNFEAFRAFNYLLNKSEQELDKVTIDKIANGTEYNIYQLICNAYIVLLCTLYGDADKNKSISKISQSIVEGKPYNIRTGEFDGKVLSSIKSDPIILDAIGRIVGTVFLTNQFLVEAPEFNTYMEAAEPNN